MTPIIVPFSLFSGTYLETQILGEKITQGIVITKYGHVQGEIPTVRCFEAGHPVPDQNSFDATEQVMQMTSHLREEDQVLLLISGGGSALFEKPLCSAEVQWQ